MSLASSCLISCSKYRRCKLVKQYKPSQKRNSRLTQSILCALVSYKLQGFLKFNFAWAWWKFVFYREFKSLRILVADHGLKKFQYQGPSKVWVSMTEVSRTFVPCLCEQSVQPGGGIVMEWWLKYTKISIRCQCVRKYCSGSVPPSKRLSSPYPPCMSWHTNSFGPLFSNNVCIDQRISLRRIHARLLACLTDWWFRYALRLSCWD